MRTPEKKKNGDDYENTSLNGSPLPNSFKFTPTKNTKLYPHLNPPNDICVKLRSSPIQSDSNESYIQKDNQSFINAMDSLQRDLFSSNITSKVLNEFSSRYESVREEKILNIQEFNNTVTNDELNRRASERFSGSHRTRFNRMESIAFHYAARRNEQQQQQQQQSRTPDEKVIDRKIIETDEDMVLSDYHLTPGDKRLTSKTLESATKRLKIDELKFVEIDDSPTKTQTEKEKLKDVYQQRHQQQYEEQHFQLQQQLRQQHLQQQQKQQQKQQHKQQHKHHHQYQESKHQLQQAEKSIPSYLQPTKSSIQRSSSSKSISPSKSSKSINQLKESTPSLKPAEKHTGLSKSPSISPSKQHTPKLSPSRAYSNLNKILTSSPEKLSSPTKEEKPKTPITRIPRSKTSGSMNLPSHNISNSKLKGESNTKTNPTAKSKSYNNLKSISTSSSIPRLARLVTAEARLKDTAIKEKPKWR